MDKLMTKLMPMDVWSVAADYLFGNMHIQYETFPKYKYILNTFAKNISYIKNNRILECNSTENVADKISLSSNLGVLKYVCSKLTKHHAYEIFHYACINGNLKMLKYLTNTFGLNRSDIYDDVCRYAFGYASRNGHLETLTYLTNTFKLDKAYAIARDNYAFRSACEKGHLKVVMFLTETFKLNRSDAITGNNYALRSASENGHLETLAYLTNTFGLTCYAYAGSIYAFINGHSKILTYPAQTFRITQLISKSNINIHK